MSIINLRRVIPLCRLVVELNTYTVLVLISIKAGIKTADNRLIGCLMVGKHISMASARFKKLVLW